MIEINFCEATAPEAKKVCNDYSILGLRLQRAVMKYDDATYCCRDKASGQEVVSGFQLGRPLTVELVEELENLLLNEARETKDYNRAQREMEEMEMITNWDGPADGPFHSTATDDDIYDEDDPPYPGDAKRKYRYPNVKTDNRDVEYRDGTIYLVHDAEIPPEYLPKATPRKYSKKRWGDLEFDRRIRQLAKSRNCDYFKAASYWFCHCVNRKYSHRTKTRQFEN